MLSRFDTMSEFEISYLDIQLGIKKGERYAFTLNSMKENRPIYKYLHQRDVDYIFSDHSFKLGTLHEYKSAMYEGDIGDNKEGTKLIVIKNQDVSGFSDAELKKKYSFIFESKSISISDSKKLLLDSRIDNHSLHDVNDDHNIEGTIIHALRSGVPLGVHELSPNCYIYCTSYTFDRDLMKKMNSNDPYDACIKISNPKNFFLCLADTLHDEVGVSTFGKCVYFDRFEEYNGGNGLHTQMLKSPRFSYQDEVRMIFDPIDENVKLTEKKIVISKEAVKYCTLLKV